MSRTFLGLGLAWLGLGGCVSRPQLAQIPVNAPPPLHVQQIAPPTSTPLTSAAMQLEPTPIPAPSAQDVAVLQVAQSLKEADPLGDADNAWQNGDKRLVGIQTMGVEVPGVDGPRIEELLQKRGVKIIAQVGDANTTKAEETLYRVAFRYGAQYNRRMLAKFAEQDKN